MHNYETVLNKHISEHVLKFNKWVIKFKFLVQKNVYMISNDVIVIIT